MGINIRDWSQRKEICNKLIRVVLPDGTEARGKFIGITWAFPKLRVKNHQEITTEFSWDEADRLSEEGFIDLRRKF